MTSPGRDPISFVEACYDLSATEQEWLQAVADNARPLMRALTVLSYHYDIDDRGLHLRGAAQSGESHGDVVGRIVAIGKTYDKRRAGTAGWFESLRSQFGLAPLEARVVGLAARGYSDKLVAYHLGVAEGTVAAQLSRGLRKLGMSRVELVRTLGGSSVPVPEKAEA